MKKDLCIISFKPLNSDPRIYRQVHWTREHYEVYTVGPADTRIPGIPCVDMGYRPKNWLNFLHRGSLLVAHQHEGFYWNTPHIQHTWRRLQALKPPLIIANELECWPLAVKAKQNWNCKILLDAHEFYPGMLERDFTAQHLYLPYTNTMCRKTLPFADVITTVSEALIAYYQETFGCQAHLILNAPFYQDLSVQQNTSETLQLIHHGFPMANRQPELLIEAMDYAEPRFELTFMFKTPSHTMAYTEKLKAAAQHNPRIKFREAVPMPEIPQTINHYDIGVHHLPPINLNHEGALPNKFFEFIQARLAVLFTPTKEVARLIKNYDLGYVSQAFSAQSLGQALNQFTRENILYYKQQAHKASQELCAETSGKHFLTLIQAMESAL